MFQGDSIDRRRFLWALGLPLALGGLPVQASPARPNPLALVGAARSQIGVTRIYDPAYIHLPYPGGDVPSERGVCTDVVIRAYRQAFGFDLQRQVHEDMAKAFTTYPGTWGMKRPDRNIDHRRVPNLQAFFRRRGAALPVSDRAVDYRPGDLVTQMLDGRLPHIAIVSDRKCRDGCPLVIHNIGRGTQEEDYLFGAPITGHYRFTPQRRHSVN